MIEPLARSGSSHQDVELTGREGKEEAVAEEVRVTPVQKRAAQILINLRKKTGKPIPESVVKIANAQTHEPPPVNTS